MSQREGGDMSEPIKSKCGCKATQERGIIHCNRHSTKYVRELEAECERLVEAASKFCGENRWRYTTASWDEFRMDVFKLEEALAKHRK